VRQGVALVLIVVGTVVAPLAAVAVWARDQVLDTSSYVSTVAPLATSKNIQSAVADRVSKALATQPGVQAAVSRAVQAVLSSPQFTQLWKEANRVAHDQVVALLEGRGHTRIENGKVVLDLTPVAQRVYTTLHEQDPQRFPAAQLPAGSLTFEIFESSNLHKARRVVHWLDRLAVVLPILALVLLGLAVLVARHRRRALVWAGLGLAIGLGLLLAGLGLARHAYLDAVDQHVPRGAADDFVEVLLRSLRDEARWGIVAGVVVAVAAGLAARRLSPRPAARIAIVAGACLALAAWGTPTVAGVVAIAGVAAAGIVAAFFLPTEAR
jgi:hypothetical protein